MSNTLQQKRSSVAGKQPLASDLEVGELAINLADKLIFTKDGGGTIIQLGGGGATTNALVKNPVAGVSQAITIADAADTGLTITPAVGQTADTFKIGTKDFVVNAAGNVGIGNNAPLRALHISSDVGNNGAFIDVYNSIPNIALRTANGTAALPTNTITGDYLGNINFRGYGDTKFSTGRSALRAIAVEDFTDLAQGTDTTLSGTPIGTVSLIEYMRITSEGLVGIGTASPDAALEAIGTIKSRKAGTSKGNSGGALQLSGSRGTVDAPTESLAGDFIGVISASAYDSTGAHVAAAARIDFVNEGLGHERIASLSFRTSNGASPTEHMRITAAGIVRVSGLAGTGNRMVVANATGDLATQAILNLPADKLGVLGNDGTGTLTWKPIATSGMTFVGATDPAAMPASPQAGDFLLFNKAGTVGGVTVNIGDMGVYDGTKWDIIPAQQDLSAYILAPATAKAGYLHANGAGITTWVNSIPWASVSGKPATFAPIIGATATTAAAGNHNHNTLYYTHAQSDARYARLKYGNTFTALNVFSGAANANIRLSNAAFHNALILGTDAQGDLVKRTTFPWASISGKPTNHATHSAGANHRMAYFTSASNIAGNARTYTDGSTGLLVLGGTTATALGTPSGTPLLRVNQGIYVQDNTSTPGLYIKGTATAIQVNDFWFVDGAGRVTIRKTKGSNAIGVILDGVGLMRSATGWSNSICGSISSGSGTSGPIQACFYGQAVTTATTPFVAMAATNAPALSVWKGLRKDGTLMSEIKNNGKFYVSGVALASDESVKSNITDSVRGLAEIRQIKAKNYIWDHDEDKSPQLGFLAGDIEKVLPEAVLHTPLETPEQWDAATHYAHGDHVTHQSKIYHALRDVAVGIPPDDVYSEDEGTGGWMPLMTVEEHQANANASHQPRKHIDMMPLMATMLNAINDLAAKVEALESP